MNKAFLPAHKLAALVRQGKIGCLELLNSYLERVEKYNPALNAIVVFDIERAKKRARAADRALAKGEVWGPLHGVPMTVKESFDVEGLPTTWGRPDLKTNIPARSANCVERYTEAGALLFGKTNVPALLADWQSFNAIYGTTNNPWDQSKVPGGSSGGAAAALAAGLTGLETGSDIGASIRNPAHYCGVYGHKPTFGLCSSRGQVLPPYLRESDIAVIGPMARSAKDLEIALKLVAGPDETDALAWQLRLPRAPEKTVRQWKVGVLLDAPTAEIDRSVQDQIQKLADFLATRGAKVSEARPDIDLTEAHHTFIQLLRSATTRSMSDEQFARTAKLAAEVPAGAMDYPSWALTGAVLHHRQWLLLNEKRHRMRAEWAEFFGGYDLLLCPAAATPAFPHDQKGERWERMVMVNGKPQPSTTQMFWAGYSGMCYLPSTVAPIGLHEGLPVGVQIVAPQYGDLTSIAFAQMLEREYYGFVPPPGYED
ncbi:MAG: amidase [Burkholderiales bacterium]|nr:amidase [Burkholderiales bacterium]